MAERADGSASPPPTRARSSEAERTATLSCILGGAFLFERLILLPLLAFQAPGWATLLLVLNIGSIAGSYVALRLARSAIRRIHENEGVEGGLFRAQAGAVLAWIGVGYGVLSLATWALGLPFSVLRWGTDVVRSV